MKANKYNVPATYLAADSDAEALRHQLENGNLELYDDGTLGSKGSELPADPETGAIKKKQGDIPGGVLGADPAKEEGMSPEIASMINEFCSDEEDGGKASKEPQKTGDIPGGVLGVTRSF